jgi:hypothetical protein
MVALRQADQTNSTRRARRARVRAHLRLVRIDPPERVREDALPDRMAFPDTGCELAPSCLHCPLPRCKHDEPGGARRLATDARDREIVLLRTKYRAPVRMLAQAYGLSRRSVFRILAAAPAAANSTQQTAKNKGAGGPGE